jgi:hypothetical protein
VLLLGSLCRPHYQSLYGCRHRGAMTAATASHKSGESWRHDKVTSARWADSGCPQCVMLRSFGVSSIPSVVLSYGDASLGMPSRDLTGVYASRHLPEPFKEDAKRVSPLVRRATYCLLPRHLLRHINVSRTAASLSSGCPLGEKPSLSPRLGKVSHYSRSCSQLHASIGERIDPPGESQAFVFQCKRDGFTTIKTQVPVPEATRRHIYCSLVFTKDSLHTACWGPQFLVFLLSPLLAHALKLFA